MISIKEICPTPSSALEAMVDGLLEQSKRKDFVIDMQTFGSVDINYNICSARAGDIRKKMCFGCAATCFIQKVANKNLTQKNISDLDSRASALGFNPRELIEFESAIDAARLGMFYGLFCLYYDGHEGVRAKKIPIDLYNIHNLVMDTNDWEYYLPELNAYIQLLKEHGL